MRRLTAFVMCAALVLACGPVMAQQGRALNPVVWTVNGQPVHAAEISLMMQNMAAQARQQGQEPDQQQLLDLATQRVIEQKLLAQEAKRFAISNDEERVASMIENMEKQAGGREALEKNLAQGGASYDDVVKTIREMDLVMQFIDTQVAPGIKVSDEEVEAFYEKNKERFTTERQLQARHIIFKVDEGAGDEEVAAARAKAEAARQRALDGEDFSFLARELSEGPSARQGGDLGFFTADQMVPEFAETAFALEPGGISEVVRTSFGFHVIKAVEYREAGTLSLDEIRPQIVTMLRQQRIGTALKGLLETLTANGEVKPAPGVTPPGASNSGS